MIGSCFNLLLSFTPRPFRMRWVYRLTRLVRRARKTNAVLATSYETRLQLPRRSYALRMYPMRNLADSTFRYARLGSVAVCV